MNDHEATELLERLVEPLDPGEPAIWELLERGRRARGRRRGVVVVGVAAAVAAVVGGTTVLAEQLPGSSGGPSSVTSPTVDQPPNGDLNPIDLWGSWNPRQVLGDQIEPAPNLPGLSFHEGRIIAATDYCELTMGGYTVGSGGEIETRQLAASHPYCIQPGGHVPHVANDVVAYRAARVQVVAGVLTVYDQDSNVLGIYDRAWAEVAAADLLGRWRLVTLPDSRTITLEELEESLDQEAARRRALVGFERDSYQASDGINTTSGRYEVGALGRFRDWDQFTTLIGCVEAAVRDSGESTATEVEPMPLIPPADSGEDECERVPNPEILDSAVRVQWFDRMRLLVFYDDEGMAIGVYSKVR